MIIEYSPKFQRLYKKLPREICSLIKKKIALLVKDPFDQKLKTHKLSGSLKDYWAISIDYRYRIIFTFESENIIRLHMCGDHSIYQ